MLTKLVKAFNVLRQDVTELNDYVRGIDVKDGVDGVSPDPKVIAAAAAKLIPVPKDGKSPDINEVAAKAAELIPKPKDGKDAPPVSISSVVDKVLAKIKKPKDGISPDPKVIAAAAAKLIPVPKDGKSPTAAEVAKSMPAPKPGPRGPAGPAGVSVTDVQLNNNELLVFLDGKKKSAGKIKLPAISAPFRPGDLGGGGVHPRNKAPVYRVMEAASKIEQQPPGLDIPINLNFGPAQDQTTISVSADGLITFKRTAFFSLNLFLNISRRIPGGTAKMFIRGLRNGEPVFNPLAIQLGISGTSLPLEFGVIIEAKAGDTFQVQFVRDSSGADDGGLYTFTSSIGWGASSSALMLVTCDTPN